MCQKRSSVICYLKNGKGVRVDGCIRHLIRSLSFHGYHTVASCCGHSRYPLTIVCKDKKDRIFELISNISIPRKKRFYIKDKDGLYYIPEILWRNR